MPVPASPIINVELTAVELTETVPVTAPPDSGVKITLKVTLSPAARLIGRFRPLRLNLLPVAVACERVTLEPPVFVMAAVSV
jgi:hypothetical protein